MANARPILLFYTAYQKVLSKGLFEDLARSFSSDTASAWAQHMRGLAAQLFDFTPSDLAGFVTVASVFHTNMANVVRGREVVGRALYRRASLLSHSCAPNAHWVTEWACGIPQRIVRSARHQDPQPPSPSKTI